MVCKINTLVVYNLHPITPKEFGNADLFFGCYYHQIFSIVFPIAYKIGVGEIEKESDVYISGIPDDNIPKIKTLCSLLPVNIIFESRVHPRHAIPLVGFDTSLSFNFTKWPVLPNNLKDIIFNVLNITYDEEPTKKYTSSRINCSRFSTHVESLLIDLEENHGFERINFNDLLFEDQIKAMLKCKILVGQHGSNLVNAVFMKESSHLIEFGVSIPHYKNLASIFNIKYSLFNDEDKSAKEQILSIL